MEIFNLNYNLYYDYKDWKFAFNYEFTDYKNEATSKSKAFYDNLSVSIFYNKEDSLWSFELKAYNLTNNTSIRSTNFGTIVINETQTFIFPRHIMFNVIYKL